MSRQTPSTPASFSSTSPCSRLSSVRACRPGCGLPSESPPPGRWCGTSSKVHEKRYHLFVIFETNAANAGRWIGAWLPWQPETAPPAPRGFRLPRRARFTVELHYRGADQEVTDESSIDVYYSREAAQAVDELLVEGSAPARLARNATVWAIVPSAGEAATSLELTARRPDGSIDVLLWIPQLRREWPQALMLDNPLALPAGTALSLVTHPPNASGRARLSLLR